MHTIRCHEICVRLASARKNSSQLGRLPTEYWEKRLITNPFTIIFCTSLGAPISYGPSDLRLLQSCLERNQKKDKQEAIIHYESRANISWTSISARNLVMNSSALSSTPRIWGEANPSDSQRSSAEKVFSAKPPLSCTAAGWSRSLKFFPFGGQGSATSSATGPLNSLSTNTGAVFFSKRYSRLGWARCAWTCRFLRSRRWSIKREGQAPLPPVLFLTRFRGFLMALDIWSLCSLLWSLEVKLFHTFGAGGSLRLKQDMLEMHFCKRERERALGSTGMLWSCFIMPDVYSFYARLVLTLNVWGKTFFFWGGGSRN